MGPSGSEETHLTVCRSSMIDSIMAKGSAANLPWNRAPKEDIKNKVTMPLYIRLAIREAISSEAIYSAVSSHPVESEVEAPNSPLVVFINPRSGGRAGPELKERFQALMSEEQVFDLSDVKPHEFVKYGLGCIERYADNGDAIAKSIREKLRIVVAGGDGTVGWVLGCVGVLYDQSRLPVPPTAIIPLGTGNDLSRSFGWGGSFSPIKWKSAIKRTVDRATNGPVCRLDSWKLSIAMPEGEELEAPHALKRTQESCISHEGLEVSHKELPPRSTFYDGVFYNYFSIGMDAQVAYGFHHLRNEKPHLAQGPISNKLIYSGYTCKQGWFFTPVVADPSLRGLNNILRMHVKRQNSSKWEQVPIPSKVRALVALNLPSYASGRNPWGTLKPEYMERRGFVEPSVDDGLLEVFGLKEGWHASMVMGELIKAKHIAQAAAIRFEFRGGSWNESFMQMDGEPWKQPLSNDYSTFVDIQKVPFQSVLIKGE